MGAPNRGKYGPKRPPVNFQRTWDGAPANGAKHSMQAANVGADYTDEELAFLKAVDRYKRENGRPWPSWVEILDIAISLGYRKEATA